MLEYPPFAAHSDKASFVKLACFERDDGSLRNIKVLRWGISESPCRPRLGAELQDSLDPHSQFAGTAHRGRSLIPEGRTSSRPLLHSSGEGTGVEAVYMSWSLAIDAPGEQTAGGTPTTPVPGQRNTSAARVSLQIGWA